MGGLARRRRAYPESGVDGVAVTSSPSRVEVSRFGGGAVLTSGGAGVNGRACPGEAVSAAGTGLAFGALLLFLAFAVFLFGAVTARVVFALGRAVFRFLPFVAAAVLTARVVLTPRRMVFLFLDFAPAVLDVVRFRTFSLAVALARFFVDFGARFAPDPFLARLFVLLGGVVGRRLVAFAVRRDDVFFFAIPGPL